MTGFMTTLSGTLVPLMFAAAAFVLTAILQVMRRYTLPNIGYYHRKHGRHETFLIRNLDSAHYRQSLSIVVAGQDLEYVIVQAGPWCRSKLAGQEPPLVPPLRIDFSEVPEDAVFIVRARARIGDVQLRLHPESQLRSRHSFEEAIRNFTLRRRVVYYSLRYLFGLFMFLMVFIGSIWFRGVRTAVSELAAADPITTGDVSVCVLGAVVSLLAFFLVVPFKGKRTLGGYDGGPIEDGQRDRALGVCWPDEQTVIAAFDGTLGVRRKDPPAAPHPAAAAPESRPATPSPPGSPAAVPVVTSPG